MRLEPESDQRTESATRFQFHKGAIRTQSWMMQENKKQTFQFHKGAIRTEFGRLRGAV